MKEEISLGELIILILKFIKKNSILIISAAIMGVIVGFINESIETPEHKSEAVICSDIINGQRLGDIISDLETAASNGNYNYLAKLLSIPEDSAESIKSIKIELIKSETLYRTNVEMTNTKTHQCVKLICTSTRPNLFHRIESSAMELLKENKEISSIVKLRKEGYKKNIQRIKKDIEFLTEQRIKMYRQLQVGNHSIDINQFDSESQFIYAYERVTDLEELFLRTKEAVLIKPFNKETVANNSIKEGVILMAVIFIAISLAIAIFREIKL